MTGSDWLRWHDGYDEPGSGLARRLATVQERIRVVLDDCPAGPLRVLSMCAGQGRDLLDVLRVHPRRGDVEALLVELDPRNVAAAQRAVEVAALPGVEVRVGDAGAIDQYRSHVPADLVLVCGVFGNIPDADVERTIGHCTQLCRVGGHVIWTRHRRPPDLIPQICRWYEHHDFTLQWLSDPAEGFGVGVHRYAGQPQPVVEGRRMFVFDASPG